MKSLIVGISIGAVLLLSSLNATAAVAEQRYYNISATVSVDGKEVMHPHAIVETNHPARIEVDDAAENSYRVDFTVTPGEGAHANDQAKVEVSFFTKVMGNWTLRSQPSLVVWTGREASVEEPYHEGTASPRVVKITSTVTPKTKAELLKTFSGKIPSTRVCPPANNSSQVASTSLGQIFTPTLLPACCSVGCSDGSGGTLRCCGAVSCSACGTSCSP
jgi:hypothetical protein